MRTRIALLGLMAIVALLAGGCTLPGRYTVPPEPPVLEPGASAGPEAPSATLESLPDTGPGLTPGVYALDEAKLPTPWVRSVLGLLRPAGTGKYEGTLYRIERGMQARVEVSGSGAEASGKLTLDLDGNRKLDEEPVASVSAKAAGAINGKPTTRLLFPSLSVRGEQIAIGVEIIEGPAAGARVFLVQDTCRQATVKAGEHEWMLRFIAGAQRWQRAATLIWIDADGDDEAAEWELAPLQGPLGFAGKLRTFALDKPERGKLTVESYSGEVGVVSFDATDAKGQASGIYNPVFLSGRNAIQYLGEVRAVEVPAEAVQIMYGLPIGPAALALARIARPVNISAGKAVEVKAGGPVEIKLSANSGGGRVQAEINLATATGNEIGGVAGSGRSGGVVEVVGPDGDVLATGSAEFG